MTLWQLFFVKFYGKGKFFSKMGRINLSILLLAGLSWEWAALGWGGGSTGQVKKPTAYDVYLVDGRICRRCVAKPAENGLIRLIDRAGRQTVVDAQNIIGINRHPLIRRLLLHSARHIGNPGPVLAPYAFEDASDYLYRYYPLDANFQ